MTGEPLRFPWLPSRPVPCDSCGVTAYPHQKPVVREHHVYHRECVPEETLRCGPCGWVAADRGLLGQHGRLMHAAEAAGSVRRGLDNGLEPDRPRNRRVHVQGPVVVRVGALHGHAEDERHCGGAADAARAGGPGHTEPLGPDPELRARQDIFLGQLQPLEPDRPIEVQHYETDPWHPTAACARRSEWQEERARQERDPAKARRLQEQAGRARELFPAGCAGVPLWTRSMLRGEVVWDHDEPDRHKNFRHAGALDGALREAGVPRRVFDTGSKGFHVDVLLKLPPGTDDAAARRIREAVWEEFRERAGLAGVARIDRGKVGWTERSMLHAWGHVRKGPYSWTRWPTSDRPREAAMPPAPELWDASVLSAVRAVLEGRGPEEPRSGLHVGTVLEGAGLDLEDFDRFSFVRDLATPPADHDEAFVTLSLLLKTCGVSVDGALAFFRRHWRPTGPCSTQNHAEPEARVRSLYDSKFRFSPKRAWALLSRWRKSPDKVVWKAVFAQRLPLELAAGEQRRAPGCGGFMWPTCSNCGREVPREIHCRAVAVCADCGQHRYVSSAMKYRDDVQARIERAGCVYVAAVRAPTESSGGALANYADAAAFEGGVRKTIVSAADDEILRVILPGGDVVYSAAVPFSAAGVAATQVRSFGSWLRRVVPVRSLRVIYSGAADVDAAVNAWVTSTKGRHIFQSFGWHRGEGERVFLGACERPRSVCPYCGQAMSGIAARAVAPPRVLEAYMGAEGPP